MPKRGKRSLRARLRKIFRAATLGAMLSVSAALANPSGGSVQAGAANITNVAPGAMQIEQLTQKAIIDWQKFGIGAGESVRFLQPSQMSVILNRVVGQDPSKILGQLSANGNVFLINPNGILFGPNSVVNVGGLVASTLQISNEDFLSGNYRFSQDASKALASVINQGKITITDGGYALLVAPMVSNEGVIVANLGSVSMLGTQRATLNFDGRNLISYDIGPVKAGDPGTVLLNRNDVSDLLRTALLPKSVQQADSLVQNPDGTISLKAASGTVVNQGTVLAEGADGRVAGNVVLHSTNQTILGDHSVLRADGQGQHSDGGSVRALSQGTLSAEAGGVLSARGGEVSGNGGFIETSGSQHLSLQSQADVGAADGKAGVWLIDPSMLTIVDDPGSINLADTISTGFLEGVTSGSLALSATGEIMIEDIADNQLTMQDGVSLSLTAPSLVYADGADAIRVGGNANLTVDVGSSGIQNLGLLLNEGTGAVNLTVEGAVTDGNGTGVANVQADTVHLLSSTGSIGSSSSPLEVSADKVDGSGATGYYVTDDRELEKFALDSNGSDAVISAPNGTLSLLGGVLSTPVAITDTNGNTDSDGFDVSAQVNYTGGDLTLRDMVFDDDSAVFYATVDGGQVVSGGGAADVTNLGDLDFNIYNLSGGVGSLGSPITFSTTPLVNIGVGAYDGDVAVTVDNTPREFSAYYTEQIETTFTGGGISNLSGSLVVDGDPGVSRLSVGTSGDIALGSFNLDGTKDGLLSAGGNIQAAVDGVTDIDTGSGQIELLAGGTLQADIAGEILPTVTGDALVRNDSGLTINHTSVGGDMTIVNNAPLTVSNSTKVTGTLRIENAATVDAGGLAPMLDTQSLILTGTAANTSVSLEQVSAHQISVDDSAQGGGNFSLDVNGSVDTVSVSGKGTDFEIGGIKKAGSTLHTSPGGNTDFDQVSISESEDALTVDATSLLLPSTSSLTLVTTNPGAGVSTSGGGIEVAGDLTISSAGPIDVGTIVPGTLDLYAAEGTINFGDGYSAAPQAVKVRSGDGSAVDGNWYNGSMSYNSVPYALGLSAGGQPGATDIEFQLDKGDLVLRAVGGKNVKIAATDGGLSTAGGLVLLNLGDLDLQARDDIGSATAPLILDSTGTLTAQSTTGGVYLNNNAPSPGGSASGYAVGDITAFGDIVLDYNPALSIEGVVESQTGDVAVSTAFDNFFFEPGGMVKANGGSSTVSLEAQGLGSLTERNGTDPAVQALGGTVVVKTATGDIDLNIDAAAVAADSPGALTVNDLDTNGDGLQVISDTTLLGGDTVTGVTSVGDASLTTEGDLKVSATVQAGGDLQVSSTGGGIVTSGSGLLRSTGALKLEAGADIGTTAKQLFIWAPELSGSAGGLANIKNNSGYTMGTDGFQADGDLSITAGDAVTVSGEVKSLTGDVNLSNLPGDLTVNSAVSAAGDLTLSGVNLAVNSQLESGGDMLLKGLSKVEVNQAAHSTSGDIDLVGTSGVKVTAAVTADAGDVSVDASGGSFTSGATIIAGDTSKVSIDTVSVVNSGSADLVRYKGGGLELKTRGSLSGKIDVGSLALQPGTGGSIDLSDVDSNGDGLKVTTVGSLSGISQGTDVVLDTVGDLVVDLPIDVTGFVQLTSSSGNLEIGSSVTTTGGLVYLYANNGSITDTNGAGTSAVNVLGGDLVLQTGGDIALEFDGAAVIASGQNMTLRDVDTNGDGLTLKNGLSGKSVSLQTEGDLLDDNGDDTTAISATDLVLKAGGNIGGTGSDDDFETSVESLAAEAGGSLNVQELNALTVSAGTAADGSAVNGVTAQGDVSLSNKGTLDVKGQVTSAAGDVSLTAVAGTMNLYDTITSGAGKTITLKNTGLGHAIVDHNGDDLNLDTGLGGTVVVDSFMDVGISGDGALEIEAGQVAGRSYLDNLALYDVDSQADGLTVTSARGITGVQASDRAGLSTSGDLKVDEDISSSSATLESRNGSIEVNSHIYTFGDTKLSAAKDILDLNSAGDSAVEAFDLALEAGGRIGGASPGEALDIVSNTVAGKAADEMVLSQSLGLPLAVGSNTGLGGSPLEGLQSDGSVTLTSDGDVTLNSAVVAGTSATLDVGGDLMDGNGSGLDVSGTSVSLTGGGDLGASTDALEVDASALSAKAGGALYLDVAGGTVISGVLQAAGDLCLTGGGELRLQTDAVSTGGNVALSTLGDIVFDAAGAKADGAVVSLESGGDITDQNGAGSPAVVASDTAVLKADGSIGGASGDTHFEVSAPKLAAAAGSDLDLAFDGATAQTTADTLKGGDTVSGLSAGQDLSLSVDGDFAVDQAISAAGDLHLYTAGTLNLQQQVAAGAGKLASVVATGDITDGNGDDANIVAFGGSVLLWSTSGTVDVDVETLNIGVKGSSIKVNDLDADGLNLSTVSAGPSLTLAGAFGGDISLQSAGDLRDDYGVGTPAVFATGSLVLKAGGDILGINGNDGFEVRSFQTVAAQAGGSVDLSFSTADPAQVADGIAADGSTVSGISADGDVMLRGADFSIKAPVTSQNGSVAVAASGDISFEAAGAQAHGNVVSLESGGDIIDQNDSGSAAVVAFDTAVLKADGSVGGAGGDPSFEVSAPKLAATAGGNLQLALQGDTALTSAGTLKAGDTVAGLSAGQDLAVTADGSVSVDQAVSASGDATIDVQGDLQVSAAVTSTGADVGLRSSGDITLKSGGSLGATAGLASLESGGNISSEDGTAAATVEGKQTVVLAQGDVQLGLSTDTLAAKGTNLHIVDHGGDLKVGTLTTKIGKVQVVGVSANGNAGVEAEDGNLQLDSPVSGTSVTVTAGGGAVHNASSDTLKATDTLTLVSHDDIHLDHTLEAGKRVSLQSTSGEILAGDHSVDVRAPEVTLQASGDVGKPLQPISLDTDKVAAVSHHGGVYLKDQNQLEITTLDTTNGPVNGVSGAGDVSVTVGNGDLTVGGVSAGGDVGLTTGNGSILDGNGTDPNISAGGDVNLSAANGRSDSLGIQAGGTVKVSENQPQGVTNTATSSGTFRPFGVGQAPTPLVVPGTAFAQDNLDTGEYDEFLQLLDMLSTAEEMDLIVDLVTGPVDDDE